MVQLLYPYLTTGKTIALTRWTFVQKLMSLLNMLYRFVTAFLPRSKCPLISWLQSLSAVILQENKVCHCFHCFPIYLPWSNGPDAMIFVFWMLSFKPAFSLSSFTFIKSLFNSPSLSSIRVVSSAYLRLLIFLLAILKQQLELDMEQQSGSKFWKEYIKAVYCHPAYLTYMQSTSWETLNWKKHKV